MKVSLYKSTENPIETIAEIASICYDSDPADPMALVKHLYKNGHLSVFEHISFTFLIEGISRACSHQLVRHRHCSFTQRSQRYCSEDGFKATIPPSVIKKYMRCEYGTLLDEIEDRYERLQEQGIPNEDARYVLPNACHTSLYMTCNLSELIHICNERLCSRAQWEIREMVQEMVNLVPEELRFMLVPKCKSGRIICNSPCNKKD